MLKSFIKYILFLFLFTSSADAESFLNFNVTGNERVSSQTIINFTNLDAGSDLSENDLNKALKNIYDTNFFEFVNLDITNNTLNINVKEFPIIQNIEFIGIKAKKYIDILTDQISLKSRSSFNEFLLQNDLNKITNILRQSGYYFSNVDVKKIVNSNNSVSLIYDVTMGEKASIAKIKFIGDKKFKSSKLLSVIKSEEDKFWKFLSKSKHINRELTELDKRLLKNFYLEKGYYNVNVEEVFTQVLDKKNFLLTYKIEAGEKFFFNNFELLLPDDYDPDDFKNLKNAFKDLKNSKYSYGGIQSILDEIDKIALTKNYEFLDVGVSEEVVGVNKINFVFNIKDGDKFYIEQVNIMGNDVTNESFIRQKFVIDEGDPFNNLLHNKTINSLKSSNIFKSVTSDIKDGSSNGLKVINITIDEKPTGEISAGAGYGSSGSTLMVGIKENNFNGNGIKLDANLTLTEESIRGKLGYTTPNFAYSDRSLTTSVESTSTDKEENYGYKSSLNKILVGTSFEQYENLYISPSFSIASEALTTTAKASENYKKQEGTYFDFLLNYSITYSTLNSSYRPSNGLISSFTQEFPILSDGYNIINGYQVTSYKEVANDSILKMGLYTRAINTLQTNEDVRVSKRMFLPGSRLRGFEPGKVGPKDGPDYVGGNYMASFNTSLSLPFLFSTYDDVDFSLFFDAANVWHVDYSKKVDQGNSVRSSTGIGLNLITPVGPLSFSLSQPITKADGDVTETVRFNLGTTF
ncbi:outer membrane protein assembly factor BamA [Candidatus Pelagibacter sp.]|nr:outer membrane protein assembly factor BamA [Candidatus Pelagibacter sp.]